MENISSLEQNVGVLLMQWFELEAKTREVRDMDGWLEKVKGREREIDKIRKEFKILRRESENYVLNLNAIEMLSQKVIENQKAVKLLTDDGNASSKSIPTHSNELKLKKYSEVDLSNYTSATCKSVAAGGFSKVYRGKLDGMQVAIKVLNNEKVAAESFTVEVETLFTAFHPNLVKLHGYCFEPNLKALVYEYMENGSFDKILFENHLNLKWEDLYGIVLGIAKGLAYLHDDCGKNIIHRDMKPANVLIDQNLSARITDFGEAKLLSMDEKDYTITNNRGTEGYIAPEFGFPMSNITNKCDVYSYGVTLFEVLRKRRIRERGKEWFPSQVWTEFKKGRLDELIDSLGIPNIHKCRAKILSMVAFWCTQRTVEIRPSMSTVVKVLENEISVLNTPPDPFKEHSPLPDITMLPKEPFKEHSPPTDITMLQSQEVIPSESLAILNPSLVPAPDVHQDQENKEKAETNSEEESKTCSEISYYEHSDDERKTSSEISDYEHSDEESKTSSKIEKLLSKSMTGRPQQFSRSDIERFTLNFSDFIGRGERSIIYKGQFLDGVEVAIEVPTDILNNEAGLPSKNSVWDGSSSFIFKYLRYDRFFTRSVTIMGPVHHPKIVKLHGYCFEANSKALVYEYMENGSLDKILFNNHLNLEWGQLYEIAMETAKGVSALHAVGIIHYGIKASNILLGSNLSPKIKSSGIEELIKRDAGPQLLKGSRGTTGYTAPEVWMPTSVVTSKSDVYSFGMLLFEVLGRRTNGLGQEWFPNQVWKMFKKGQLSKMIEDCGINKKDREKAYNLSMVAFWCAQHNSEKRPSMSRVVKMLQMEIPVMDPPNPFPFWGSSTSLSPEGSPRFNPEASASIELSFHEKGYALTDSDDDRGWDEGRELESMLNSFEVKCPPGGENSIVLYTRTVGSMGRLRECNSVRSILKLHQVEIFERNLSTNLVYSAELRNLLESTEVPALFVRGRFIGGVLEVKSLDEEGKLKILLHGISS